MHTTISIFDSNMVFIPFMLFVLLAPLLVFPLGKLSQTHP